MTRKIRGGKRDGAGRPQGTGKYGEPTKAMRVPCSLVKQIQEFLVTYGQEKEVKIRKTQLIPLFEEKIAAGFPSPAEGSVERNLDLNDYVAKNPASTFFVRVQGTSMIDAGIHPDDILVVDLSIKAKNNHIIVAFVNGEFTVKRLKMTASKMSLIPENKDFPPLPITEEMDFRIWGVVTNVIHSFL